MKRITSILLLTYFCFGTFCLPRGNFSVIASLPAMYENCKATEDKDMTPLDFITDHLINIDGIFDKHENGDEQKSHSPIQIHYSFAQTTLVSQNFKISFASPVPDKSDLPVYTEDFYFSEFNPSVFRPPVV